MPCLCPMDFGVLRSIWPIIVLEELGSSLYTTALQMVVRDRAVNASYPDLSREASQQKAMTDFYMVYDLIIRLVPIIPALVLARLGDRGWRRVPIAVPLVGYVLLRILLLLVVLLRLPLEVAYGAGVVYGLFGGFGAYWPGIMTLAALSSTAADRSKVLMKVELLYGISGLVGSLVSGHLFNLYSSSLGNGTILISVSTLLNLLCLLHSVVLLQVKPVSSEQPEDTNHLLPPASSETSAEVPAGINRVNLVLLFTAAVLYNSAVGGAMQILGVWVLKEPLSWNAAQVGYGQAAGCAIFLTSFLGVIVFRRFVRDAMLILIGMMSFALGIYFMSFVTSTTTFYLARSLNLFALIPMPTIRSVLSQQVPATSCGTTLTSLQIVLKFAGLAYIPAFTKIYQKTVEWFPGLVFCISSSITVLAMIPISIVSYRSSQRQQDTRVQGD